MTHGLIVLKKGKLKHFNHNEKISMRLFINQFHYTVFKESILHTPSSNVLVESCVMGVSVEVCRDTILKGLGDLFKLLGDDEEFITACWY